MPKVAAVIPAGGVGARSTDCDGIHPNQVSTQPRACAESKSPTTTSTAFDGV